METTIQDPWIQPTLSYRIQCTESEMESSLGSRSFTRIPGTCFVRQRGSKQGRSTMSKCFRAPKCTSRNRPCMYEKKTVAFQGEFNFHFDTDTPQEICYVHLCPVYEILMVVFSQHFWTHWIKNYKVHLPDFKSDLQASPAKLPHLGRAFTDVQEMKQVSA